MQGCGFSVRQRDVSRSCLEAESRSLDSGDRDVSRAGLEVDVAGRGTQVHVARPGLDAKRALGAIGRDIGRRHVNANCAVDVRDERFPDTEVEGDVLTARNADAEIGVRLEAVARASGDTHLTPFPEPAAAFVPAVIVTKRAVIAHPQRRIPAAPPAPLRHHDDVVGIDDPQGFAAAQRPRLHIELRGVGTAALYFHDDVAAPSRAGLDPQIADEVVDGDRVAFQGIACGLCGNGIGEHGNSESEQRRTSDHSGSTRSWH